MAESKVWCFLHYLHRYFYVFIRMVLVAFHGKHGPSIPPIDDQILLESATSIAEKIRTKEVRVAR